MNDTNVGASSAQTELAQRAELILAFQKDPVVFLKTIVPHWFPEEVVWYQRAMLALALRKMSFLYKYGDLDKIEKHFPMFTFDKRKLRCKRHGVFIFPRGFGKTTVFNGAMLYLILMQRIKVAVYISNSGEHAERQLETIKRELETNEVIIDIFGNQKPEHSDPQGWTNKQIETTTGVYVTCRGSKAQVRGMNIRGARPDVVYIDDVESQESVATYEQRLKMKNYILGDVLPMLSPDKKSFVLMFGTMLHQEAILTQLANDKEFDGIKLGCIDLDGDALWSYKMDLKKIAYMRQTYEERIALPLFMMEYMSIIQLDASRQISRDMFFYFKNVNKGELRFAMAIDPAISSKKQSSKTAICVVAGDPIRGGYYIFESLGKRGMSPAEQVECFLEFQQQYNIHHCGVESIAYQAALLSLINQERQRRERHFLTIPITHTQRKEERIMGLVQPIFASHQIRFCKHCPDLEQELLDMPQTSFMDEADALAMAISVLNKYFYIPAIKSEAEARIEEDRINNFEVRGRRMSIG